MSYAKARYEDKRAPLHSDFARELMTKRFGPEITQFIYDNMPRYQRGQHKGQPKGFLQWLKVESGGWTNSLPASPSRGVVKPGTQFLRVTWDWDRMSTRVYFQGDDYGDDTIETKCDRIKRVIEAVVESQKSTFSHQRLS